jgi:hypothetical protein
LLALYRSTLYLDGDTRSKLLLLLDRSRPDPYVFSNRNLLLSDTAFALLLQHLKFLRHLKLLPKATLQQAFPKLELIAITDHTSLTKISLYKPLSIADILERLKTDKFKEPTFFGTTINRKAPAEACCPGCRRSLEAGVETITELILQDGAYLVPGSSDDVVGFHAEDPTKLVAFRLIAFQKPEDSETSKLGIKQVLQSFRCAQEKNPKVKDMVFRIEAPAAWLDVLADAVSSAGIIALGSQYLPV